MSVKEDILEKLRQERLKKREEKRLREEYKKSPMGSDFLGNIYRIILFGIGHYTKGKVFGATVQEITRVLNADKDRVRWAVWQLSKYGFIKDTTIKRSFYTGGGKMIVWTATDKLEETFDSELVGAPYERTSSSGKT